MAFLPAQLELFFKKSQRSLLHSFNRLLDIIFVEHSSKPLPVSTVNAILAACPGITDVLVHYCKHLPDLAALAGLECLRHLTLTVQDLFHQSAIDFTEPLFRGRHEFRDPGHMEGITPALMRQDTRLRCIVLLVWDDEDGEYDLNSFRPLSDDDRFVCIEAYDHYLDWLRGADAASGDNYWARAEAFIAAKRSSYIIYDEEFSHTLFREHIRSTRIARQAKK
ncbi:hypothetical protein B0H19DRAFT_1072535 [Mycena capillaripes]|nr:hypothetical protein B0H19DRAFT_1072535 [Mycena capillaripes]